MHTELQSIYMYAQNECSNSIWMELSVMSVYLVPRWVVLPSYTFLKRNPNIGKKLGVEEDVGEWVEEVLYMYMYIVVSLYSTHCTSSSLRCCAVHVCSNTFLHEIILQEMYVCTGSCIFETTGFGFRVHFYTFLASPVSAWLDLSPFLIQNMW